MVVTLAGTSITARDSAMECSISRSWEPKVILSNATPIKKTRPYEGVMKGSYGGSETPLMRPYFLVGGWGGVAFGEVGGSLRFP